MPELEAPEEEGEVDETGVDEKDIELVMQQVRGMSRYLLANTNRVASGELLTSKGRASTKRQWRGPHQC